MTRSYAGICAPSGRVRQDDLRAFKAARLRLIRLRARVNAPDDLHQWRAAGAVSAIVQLVSPLPVQKKVTPRMFVEHFAKDIAAFMKCGARIFEVHNEPNRPDMGMGLSWMNGDDFATWFFETNHMLRTVFGDTIKIGFPALCPAHLTKPGSAGAVDEMNFLEKCLDAMGAADWVALHTYWRTAEEMRDYDGAMRFLRLYLEQLPRQLFFMTEFANIDLGLSSVKRGEQLVEFYTTLAQYDQLAGFCCLPLRSNDPGDAPLAWLDPDGKPRPVLKRVVQRPVPPDPQRVKMTWPTEYHQYNQYFGAHQTVYHDADQLSAGHNGVDLRVDREIPHKSPIYAALPGTVIQVALEQTGYGHATQVRSYDPDGDIIELLYAHLSSIEVSVGTLVGRGDIIGWAGATGDTAVPQLHFGMRVPGIPNAVAADWLNPRPYLEAAP
ncbi:MAG: M23 family metallopeptidase [Anaerolineae bacterium]|nr:M23 family metallopeptidase [Anaerolineae bacterium]